MKEKSNRGAKTKYKKEFAKQAEIACAEGGFTDIQLAKLFSVDKATINRWKRANPEFRASIKKAKDDHDTGNVEISLLKRATGYRYTETTQELKTLKDPDTGLETTQLIVTKKVKKDVAPDTGACGIWLFNRQPDRWKNKQLVEHSGEIKSPSLVVRIEK